ncbi:MAG: glycerol-3-phosphate 1-O-acyltransferase PlsY [Blastocatellia bacterium]|jgi:glycerol-3-phosphate acyltransferase PlsY|nr:glycerol-3-phosphate 1-O-acyltransferase PlsY [Blastocatellia bacterium]MBK6428700.1 glycerol-3-phosphate 1-O-acyltransferase PlsY [Blastocatellia bacterium]
MTLQLISLAVAYILGAVPFGYVIVRLTSGQDVRGGGSGSIGATNVTRTAGLKAGALTYLLDVAKGMAAVAIMLQFTSEPVWLGLAAAATILGHVFPVFLGFKGGKGVATGVGAYLIIAPLAVLTTLVVWAVIFWRWRMVSVASIVATALVPVWVLLWYGWVWPRPDAVATAISTCVGCFIVIAKHHENIRRLLAGTESRFSTSSKSEAP